MGRVAHDSRTMKSLVRTYGPAVLSGVLLAIAFPSWGLFPAAWVALVPLLVSTAALTPRAAFGRFLLAGWVFNSLLLYWLITNVYWAGGWAFWGYQALCVVLGLFWGLAGLAWAWTRLQSIRLGGAVGLALLWVTMEFSQTHLFSGFGWGAVAYSQGGDLPVAQWAALGGAPLVSFVIVLFNALATLAIVEKGKTRALRIAAALLVVGAVHGVGVALMRPADYDSKPLRAGVVQASFPLEMKRDWEYTEEMVRATAEKSRLLAQHEKVDLFVWPEGLMMDDITTPGIQERIAALTKETGCALFTGATRTNPKTGGSANSSYLVDKNGAIIDYYDKVHLAPFGEYIPLEDYLPFIRQVVPAIGAVEAGAEQKVLPIAGRTLGPLICFEVLFANLSEHLREKGADVLVVITDLGWFGTSSAIPQELELARMRAIETRLPLIHCANTGISGVFDPWGRFTLVNAVFTRSGNYARIREDVPATATILQRVAGALPMAAPGSRPIPKGPVVFPWLALSGAAALLMATAFSARKNTKKSR